MPAAATAETSIPPYCNRHRLGFVFDMIPARSIGHADARLMLFEYADNLFFIIAFCVFTPVVFGDSITYAIYTYMKSTDDVGGKRHSGILVI